MHRVQPVRRRLLRTLYEVGHVADQSGRATIRLAELMNYERRPISLVPLLSALETDGFIEREVKGKRCYQISLTSKGRAFIELEVEIAKPLPPARGAAPRSLPPERVADPNLRDPPRAFDLAARPLDWMALVQPQIADLYTKLGVLGERIARLEAALAEHEDASNRRRNLR